MHTGAAHDISHLESKDLVLELADGAGLGEAETLGGLLQTANHGRGAAQEDLDIAGRLGKPFLYALLAQTWRIHTIKQGGRGQRTVIMSVVTKPTPPVQPSGGLSST